MAKRRYVEAGEKAVLGSPNKSRERWPMWWRKREEKRPTEVMTDLYRVTVVNSGSGSGQVVFDRETLSKSPAHAVAAVADIICVAVESGALGRQPNGDAAFGATGDGVFGSGLTIRCDRQGITPGKYANASGIGMLGYETLAAEPHFLLTFTPPQGEVVKFPTVGQMWTWLHDHRYTLVY